MSVAAAAVGAGLLVAGATHLHHPAPRAATRGFGVVAVGTPQVAGSAAASAPSMPSIGGRSPDGSGVPLRVRIPRLHVDAPVVPVRSADGGITVPTSPSMLGWWVGGAVPGSLVGTTVIVGHVDSAALGAGALFHLDEIRKGDIVTVRVTGNETQRYVVTALRSVPKITGLSSQELSTGGSARLTLITCGGPFDRATKSYEDNVVAFAQPVLP